MLYSIGKDSTACCAEGFSAGPTANPVAAHQHHLEVSRHDRSPACTCACGKQAGSRATDPPAVASHRWYRRELITLNEKWAAAGKQKVIGESALSTDLKSLDEPVVDGDPMQLLLAVGRRAAYVVL
jgi:hypothetical protein